jgi:hypothetical protein
MNKPEQIADTAATVSVVLFLGLSLNQWDIIVHILAGLVAVVAGICAVIYNILKIHDLTKKHLTPKKYENEKQS